MSSAQTTLSPTTTPTLSQEAIEKYVRMEISLVVLMKIGGLVSCVSSVLLMRHIILKSKTNWSKISLTNTMLVGISVSDLIGSFFWYFMGNWMSGATPWNTDVASLYAGNTKSCTAQGFFGTLTFIYSLAAYTMLGGLYCLIVLRGWTTHQMKKNKIRATFLLPPILISLASSVPPLFYEMYNPSGSYCNLAPYPFGCEYQDPGSETYFPCTRGRDGLIAMKYTYLYAFICNIIIVAFMILLVCNVYSQEKKRDRYTTEGEQNKRDTTIKTAWQGVRYAGAITIPYIPFYVWMVSWFTREYMTERGIWINSYLIHIFSPLVGFFNACVYFYPRYKTIRRRNQDKSKFQCFCETLGVGSESRGSSFWSFGSSRMLPFRSSTQSISNIKTSTSQLNAIIGVDYNDNDDAVVEP